MTELKDGIKKIVKCWMENEWATPDMSRTDEQRYDDLAQRIADSLVVDNRRICRILNRASFLDSNTDIAKAIAKAKPIGIKNEN